MKVKKKSLQNCKISQFFGDNVREVKVKKFLKPRPSPVQSQLSTPRRISQILNSSEGVGDL